MKQYEYAAGEEARKNFERSMKTLFKATKQQKKQKPPKAAKADKPDADRN